jgi:hypothetical protein
MPKRKSSGRKQRRKKPTEFELTVTQLQEMGGMPQTDDGIGITVRTQVCPTVLHKYINKLNWKKHTKRQLSYVSKSIEDNGWAGVPIFDSNTMRLINGHGRLKEALEKKWTSIPVDVGWWTEDQGNLLLASLDPTTNMASVDGAALASLTESTIKRLGGGKSPLMGAMKDINAFAQDVVKKSKDNIVIRSSKRTVKEIIDSTKKTKRDKRETGSDHHEMYDVELREDIIFPSSNEYGIPDLSKSKLYTNTKQLPIDTFDRSGKSLRHDHYYCESARPFDSERHMKPEGGFLGFYTDDRYFEKCYNNPAKFAEKLIDEKWYAVLEPDFSTYNDWPFALRLWAVYRSRWLCRYWQQLGIHVIPIIRRTNDLERDQWLYTSLPEKCPVMAMQLRMGGVTKQKDSDYWNNMGAILHHVQQHNGLKFVLFHAGEELEKYILGKLPEGLKYRFITPFINKRKKHVSSK